jgi:beta-glucosidase
MEALSPLSLDTGSPMDANASPFDSAGTSSTPNTEFSPPDSPIKTATLFEDKRSTARRKLKTLTQSEKVLIAVRDVAD